MSAEGGRRAPWDRLAAAGLGLAVAVVAYFASPHVIDHRAWQPICEGALLRPPELFLPGLYRLLVYALARLFGLGVAVRLLGALGPVALGVVAYEAHLFSLSALLTRLRVDPGRAEFRAVMLPVLTAVGLGLFLLSSPVLHAAWVLTPSLVTLTLLALVVGALRRLWGRSSLGWGYWGAFLAGVLSAESVSGFMVTLAAVGVCWRIVRSDEQRRFILSAPYVYHVAKWAFSVLWLLGAGLTVAVNAWFFEAHGGIWAEAFRGFLDLPDPNALAVMVGIVVVPLVVTLVMMPRSSDSEAYLPYLNGMLLMLLALASILFCRAPEIVSVENECVRMLLLFAAAFTTVAALLTLLVDVYCRVQTRYPRLTRVVVFRLVVAILLVPIVAMVALDGTRKLAKAVDRAADEVVAESEGCKRLFSDGAMDTLVELKSALKGGRLHAHSLLGGRNEHAASLRVRDVSGDDDLSMMRIGASVALASWVATDSPELASSAVQLGLESWKRCGKALPAVGGLVVLSGGTSAEKMAHSRAWADDFAKNTMEGAYERAYARCCEKRLREAFDLVKWRVGRMLELRADECEARGVEEEARNLRRTVRCLDRGNESLIQLRAFMNLLWNQDNMQLTPRESLKIALDRGNFRAARPHAEAVLSSDPEDVAANFALGMYFYQQQDFPRADRHLSLAHKGRPLDAAILNNLALVRMYEGKLAEAEGLANEALKLKPDVQKIARTLEEIRARQSKRSK